MNFSAAMTSDVAKQLADHLLQHIKRQELQEDLCFALWRPSEGASRYTALIVDVVRPLEGERVLDGNVSFLPSYLQRVVGLALENNAGIAFLHCHFTPGWQGMSQPDIEAEQLLAPRVFGSTGLPLIGLTMGTDGALSARFWQRVSRGQFERKWCGSVRIIGDDFGVTFMERIAPKPAFKEELKRTFSAWGEDKQGLIARLHCGVVGAGSVGALTGEALARMGVENISLIDHDIVKKHNLDRLLHANVGDIGRLKVDVAADYLRKNGTAEQIDVRTVPHPITTDVGYRAALDCDVLFSCVDRPWPRQVMNVIGNSHLIPVIDGGIRVSVTKAGMLKGADWRAHVALPGRPCLECLGQFDPAHVGLEREGLLDDPSYIENLPREHFIHRNENVFAFAMNAAGLMVLQFLSLAVQPSGISDVGPQIFHFVTGTLDKDKPTACKPTCPYSRYHAYGDHFPFPIM